MKEKNIQNNKQITKIELLFNVIIFLIISTLSGFGLFSIWIFIYKYPLFISALGGMIISSLVFGSLLAMQISNDILRTKLRSIKNG